MSIVRSASALGLLGLLSCSGGSVATQPTDDSTALYWELRLDHGAVTLALQAPYDTLTVVATPLNPEGEPLEGLGTVTLRSTDLARVQVRPDGVLQAIDVADRVAVVAELYARGVTHVDTVFVRVTAAAPARPVASLSIDPVPPDSAKFAAHGDKLIVPIVTDVDGAAVGEVLVDFGALDSVVARIDRASGLATSHYSLGPARFVATATAYGTRLTDTTTYWIGLPVYSAMEIHPGSVLGATTATAFSSTSIRVAAGGTVLWVWMTDIPTDITFDDPTHVEEDPVGFHGLGAFTGSGNVPPTACDPANPLECIKTRRFPVPGVYRYRSTLTGAAGQIVVETDEPATP